MSRFGIQLKLRLFMKHIARILILSLCVVISLTACRKNHHTPEQPQQKIPLSFSAQSQETAVKAGTEDFPHNDFGVLGIASQQGNDVPYILWGTDAMCQVTKSTVAGSEDYIPAADAYWFRGFEYTFFALAPYAATTSDIELGSASSPSLAFTYEMGDSCSDNDFMIATAAKKYDGTTGTSQEIIFWHFFAKIRINISFVGADGKPVENENNVVRGIRLCNVATKGSYVLSHADKPVLSDAVLDPTSLKDFSTSENDFTVSEPILYIIPQDISGLEMYIDFTMATEDGVGSSDNFKLTLNFADNSYYKYNQVYNWNITIGPKEAIGFNVTVNPWEDAEDDFEFPIE